MIEFTLHPITNAPANPESPLANFCPRPNGSAYVALIAADGHVDKAWALATQSAPALLDLLGAMPLIRDPSQRALMYAKLMPLLDGLPKELKTGTDAKTEADIRLAAMNGQPIRTANSRPYRC